MAKIIEKRHLPVIILLKQGQLRKILKITQIGLLKNNALPKLQWAIQYK